MTGFKNGLVCGDATIDIASFTVAVGLALDRGCLPASSELEFLGNMSSNLTWSSQQGSRCTCADAVMFERYSPGFVVDQAPYSAGSELVLQVDSDVRCACRGLYGRTFCIALVSVSLLTN